MSRDFDGTDDNIDFGSDASIDGFTTKSLSLWLRADGTGSLYDLIVGKGTGAWALAWNTFLAPDGFDFFQAWAGADESNWRNAGGEYAAAQIKHIAVTYDSASATNDPVLYINGVATTWTVSGTRTEPADSDATASLRLGEDSSGTSDFDGAIEHFCYASGIWTAAQVNRARWWGRPGGGVEVYHPLVTDKLTNEGTATANGSATGTTVAALVTPVVRRGTAMLGMGIGW